MGDPLAHGTGQVNTCHLPAIDLSVHHLTGNIIMVNPTGRAIDCRRPNARVLSTKIVCDSQNACDLKLLRTNTDGECFLPSVHSLAEDLVACLTLRISTARMRWMLRSAGDAGGV
jgi:hypothetical protein